MISCQSEEEKQQQAIMNEFTKVGNRMAKISFESISGNLKAATATGGLEKAIQFCNLNARLVSRIYPLTCWLSHLRECRIGLVYWPPVHSLHPPPDWQVEMM